MQRIATLFMVFLSILKINAFESAAELLHKASIEMRQQQGIYLTVNPQQTVPGCIGYNMLSGTTTPICLKCDLGYTLTNANTKDAVCTSNYDSVKNQCKPGYKQIGKQGVINPINNANVAICVKYIDNCNTISFSGSVATCTQCNDDKKVYGGFKVSQDGTLCYPEIPYCTTQQDMKCNNAQTGYTPDTTQTNICQSCKLGSTYQQSGKCISDCVKLASGDNITTTDTNTLTDDKQKCACDYTQGIAQCCNSLQRTFIPGPDICVVAQTIIDYCVSYSSDQKCSKCYNPYDYLNTNSNSCGQNKCASDTDKAACFNQLDPANIAGQLQRYQYFLSKDNLSCQKEVEHCQTYTAQGTCESCCTGYQTNDYGQTCCKTSNN